MRKNLKANVCTVCSKRINLKSKTIINCSVCSHRTHLKCLQSKQNTPLDVIDLVSYICSFCIGDALPFAHLNEQDFLSSLFELQNGSSPYFNFERLNNLSFHPFRDDNSSKSKANFIDNFCDPDERIFSNIDHMTDKCSYFTEEGFQTLTSSNVEFSLIHLNIRSLRKHFQDLTCYLESLNHQFDVVALSETWIKETDNMELFTLHNFHPPVTLNRPNADGGGGLALYINCDYNFKIREELTYNSDDTQFLFIEVEKDSKISLIGVTYKPPRTTIENYTTILKDLLDKIGNSRSNHKSCYLAGDFNIDLLKSDNNENISSFFNSLLSYSYFPTIIKPTRITDTTATLIDNIYTNVFDVVNNLQTGILYTDISDHLPVFIIQYGQAKTPQYKNISKRIYSKQAEKGFIDDVSAVDWSSLYDNNDPDWQYNYLMDTINNIYNLHFPIKSCRVKVNSTKTPWITPGILKSIRRKNKLYRLKIKNPTQKNVAKFRNYIYRNKLNHLIRFTKKSYYNDMLNCAQSNVRTKWKVINEMLNKKKTKRKEFPSIQHNNKQHKDKTDIANIFNTFFTNVGPSLAKKFPNNNLNKHRDWMNISCETDFNIPLISAHSVLDELYNLDESKAVGQRDLPISYIKKVAEQIHQPLLFIFNTSLITSRVPDAMKVAKVIPIFKSGSTELVSNYRPISLLPTFSKIFEKLVCSALTNHLESNKLLFDYQFGFRKKRSTIQAALDFVTRITDAIDNGNIPLGVFLDLSKAFDTVSHEILLDKLSFYGLSPLTLRWFKSYLENRRQYVCIDETFSEPKKITYGIPQGSTLGPILFLIFVNDVQFVTKSAHLLLYADDMNLLYSHKKLKNTVELLNKEFALLNDWFDANKLTVNVSKTKYIMFGTKQKLRSTMTDGVESQLFLTPGQAFNRASSTRFLGLELDSNLKWNQQIDYISRKIAKSIGILYKCRHYLDLATLKNLYYSFIYPYISYGALIWGSNYKTKILPLHILQKRALRVITFSDSRTPSRPLFQNLEILNVFEIVKLQLCEIAYNFANDQLLDLFTDYFHDLNSVHTYNTRSKTNKNLYIPRQRLNYGKFGIKFAAASQWNEVPIEIKNSPSLSCFRKAYKKNLLLQK